MSRQRTHPVDIRTVAQRAGVSIATVSRVMNQVSSVDAKLASRVLKAAKELNYTPNTQARALVSGRSRLIGLIVSEITNPFFPELIQAFEVAAVERGYEILIGSTNYSPERMTQCVRRMVERKVEGVAVMTFGMDEDLLQELSGRGIPVVSVGSTRKLESASSIEIDYRRGIREAVQHLAVMGHRDISFISGPLNLRAAKLRQTAYVTAMAEIGVKVPSSYMIKGDHTMEGGFAAALQLFDRDHLPTAVLCSNDMTAIGVLHAVSSRGLRVPEDISIIGFDDIHMAQFTVPPLTSVRMAGSDLATAACNALPLSPGLNGHPISKDRLLVPTQLTVRQTSGYVRKGNGRSVAGKKKVKPFGRAGKNME
jgi:DNA-binding LacI/PurR family transcriptional regulator